MGIIGLCFDMSGRIIVATSDSLYRLKLDIYGTLVEVNESRYKRFTKKDAGKCGVFSYQEKQN